MSSSLIQNYISSKPASAKPMPDFDIQKELDNRTFIKPLPGKGRLLTGNILSSPKYTVDNFIYSMRAFKHAAKGDANDHELGKLNDLGLMGGGLLIASYLCQKRFTPMTKGMEFVGFGAFMASMALWPKIAIQLPAYLIHGVNVQKKYQDSFGRKKPFYQDPQFIPWDLYTDKQIQKIGDRMGVDKNIPNRRDFIQEKMKKLAVQNNTLWMLTAGFATPVMTALICNVSEPYLLKYLNNKKNKKADKILANVEEYSKKYQTHSIEKGIEQIAKEYKDKPIDNNLIEKIFEIFSEDIDAVTSESLKKDLQIMLKGRNYSINETTAQNISKNIKEILLEKDFSKEFVDAVIPDENEMVKIFTDNDFMNEKGSVGIKKIQEKIANIITKNTKIFNESNPDLAEDAKLVRKFIFAQETKVNPFIKGLTSASSLDSTAITNLKNCAKLFDRFVAKLHALDEYALIKTGSAPETIVANYWNNVSSSLIKSFGITDKELEKVRFDKNLMGNLLREKIEKIVSDKGSYEKVLTNLVEKIATLNTQIKSSDLTSHLLKGDASKPDKTVYETSVDTLFDEFSASIREKGFGRCANALAGKWFDDFGSAKAIQKAFVEERLLGIKSAFYRLVNTLDFYRRVATDPNALKPYNGTVPREVMEELIELCKIITLEGHSSDNATKFYMQRNPHPQRDFSPLEVDGGKIKNKYLGPTPQGTTDIPGNKYFYQNAMKFMFEDNMHSETSSILEKSIIKDEISNYRRLVLEKIGSERYFWKPRHKVRNAGDTGSDIKFLLTGIAPNELFFKSGQQLYNTKKWLKIFGGFGASLLALTVFAQFFLGKISQKEVKK